MTAAFLVLCLILIAVGQVFGLIGGTRRRPDNPASRPYIPASTPYFWARRWVALPLLRERAT